MNSFLNGNIWIIRRRTGRRRKKCARFVAPTTFIKWFSELIGLKAKRMNKKRRRRTLQTTLFVWIHCFLTTFQLFLEQLKLFVTTRSRFSVKFIRSRLRLGGFVNFGEVLTFGVACSCFRCRGGVIDAVDWCNACESQHSTWLIRETQIDFRLDFHSSKLYNDSLMFRCAIKLLRWWCCANCDNSKFTSKRWRKSQWFVAATLISADFRRSRLYLGWENLRTRICITWDCIGWRRIVNLINRASSNCEFVCCCDVICGGKSDKLTRFKASFGDCKFSPEFSFLLSRNRRINLKLVSEQIKKNCNRNRSDVWVMIRCLSSSEGERGLGLVEM
jgi:hypothetical protein